MAMMDKISAKLQELMGHTKNTDHLKATVKDAGGHAKDAGEHVGEQLKGAASHIKDALKGD
jgi:hypothetical protein